MHFKRFGFYPVLVIIWKKRWYNIKNKLSMSAYQNNESHKINALHQKLFPSDIK